MSTATTTATIRELLTFIYDNPLSTVESVVGEFNMDSTDAEELLSIMDLEDGTLYDDGEGNYSIENQDDSLEDVLQAHTMGGGQKLTDPLQVKENKPKTKKSQKAQKEDQVDATAAPKTKAKATKAKAKPKKTTKKAKAPKVETPAEDEAEATPKPKKTKATKAKAKPKKVKAQAKTETEEQPKPKKVKKGKTQKKASRKSKTATVASDGEDKPKEKKTRVVKPRSSRIVEDKAEAKKLGVKVGTEVKACVDCRTVYDKFGGEFRPRWTDAERVNEKNPDAKASPKHVQPRCIDCDKKRSRRKTRFSGLRRIIGIEDIGDAEAIISHPDRKRGGVPDGKFSVALVDDSGDAFTPTLRGVLVTHAEGLIKLRWVSSEEPEIIGATKTAIKRAKAPKIVPPKPKPVKKAKKKVAKKKTAKPKGKAKATKKTAKAKTKTKAKAKVKVKTPKAKAKTKVKAKAPKAKAEAPKTKPW